MRKSLLFILMAMLMPVLTYAQNQAVSITGQSSYYSTKTNQRIVATNAAAGLSQDAVASADACRDYTVGLWFKTTGVMSDNPKCAILFRWGTGSHANNNGAIQLMQASTGDLTLGFGGDNFGGNATTSVGSATLNEWHHVLVAFENGVGARVYVDGAETASYTSITNFGYKWGDGIFQIGSCGFTGAIDELQFFNKALTAEEANTAYINPRNLSSLTTLYSFDAVAEGTTGQFASEAGSVTSEVATLQSVTYNDYWESGLCNSTSTSEAAPSLTEGREIAPTEASITIMDGEGGTLTATDAEGNTYSAQDDPYTISTGTLLTLTAAPEQGYNLIGIYAVQGENQTLLTGNTYTVVADAVLTARYTNETHALTVENALNIPYTITCNGETVTDLSALLGGGAEYQLTLDVPETAVLESVTLGTEALEAVNGVYSFFMDADATLTISAREKAQYTVTIEEPANGTITVTTGTSTLTSGSTVAEGTVISIAATAAAGYQLVGVKVNGTTLAGSSYTVNSDVTVTADFEEGIEYCTPVAISGRKYEKTTANTDRYVTTATVSDMDNGTSVSNFVIGTSSSSEAYTNAAFGSTSGRVVFDESAAIPAITTEAGHTIKLDINGGGSWMNTFIYFDADGDGLDADDKVYSNYTGDSQAVAGTYTFTVPADLKSGTYRVRYMLNWDDNQGPCEFGQAPTTRDNDNGEVIFDFDVVIPVQEYENARTITVASENEVYGTVAITSPATEGNTVETNVVDVKVKATPAEGYAFRSWTNAAGQTVATTAEYTYSGEEAVELTANFGHSLEYTANADGTVSVTCAGENVASGSVLPVGAEVEFTLSPANGKVVTLFNVNGTDCLADVTNGTYTLNLDQNTTAAIEFGDVTCTVSWTVLGNGTVSAGYGCIENDDETYSYNVEFTSGSMFSVNTFNDNSNTLFFIVTPGTYNDETYGTTQEDIISVTKTAGEDSNTLEADGDWINSDNFVSYGYALSAIPTEDTVLAFVFTNGGEEVAGIDEIFGDDAEDAPVEYFNLNGVRVSGDNLTPGIYVVKKGSKTVKMIVM